VTGGRGVRGSGGSATRARATNGRSLAESVEMTSTGWAPSQNRQQQRTHEKTMRRQVLPQAPSPVEGGRGFSWQDRGGAGSRGKASSEAAALACFFPSPHLVQRPSSQGRTDNDELAPERGVGHDTDEEEGSFGVRRESEQGWSKGVSRRRAGRASGTDGRAVRPYGRTEKRSRPLCRGRLLSSDQTRLARLEKLDSRGQLPGRMFPSQGPSFVARAHEDHRLQVLLPLGFCAVLHHPQLPFPFPSAG
jgi:hypothetical protein